MPRTNNGPRLVSYKPRGYSKSVFFIRWFEGRGKREKATGTDDREKAEAALRDFLAEREARRCARGPGGTPASVTISEAINTYLIQHASGTGDPERIAWAAKPLKAGWNGQFVKDVRAETCRQYYLDRRRALMAKFPERAERALGDTVVSGRTGPDCFDATIRRELGVLAAALNFCAKEGVLTGAPKVWLPPKSVPKTRWLTRSEAASLIHAARATRRARSYLALFVLIGIYTGARKRAILDLQWQQNALGGWVDIERQRIDFNPVGRRQTNKRRAIVPIPPRLMFFLKKARERNALYVIEKDGKPVGDIKSGFANAVKAARLSKVQPHVLRHTCATWLMQAGVPTREAADFLAMDEQTLIRVYYHHHPDYMKNAAMALRSPWLRT